MARKSTGKRLRFSVFQRDQFTCQYCGARPPDVVLVCDHIDPFSKSGTTTLDNLITSCESCNQGKADRSLGDRQARPDADLMYLETQQEIAELRQYQEAAAVRDDLLLDVAETLRTAWKRAGDMGWGPEISDMLTLLYQYDTDIVEMAVLTTAPKVKSGYVERSTRAFMAYMHAICRNRTREREEGDG
jgi:hypothetical protein